MKKLNVLIALFVLFTTQAFAQTFEQGQMDIDFGIGFPNTTHTAIDGTTALFNLEDDDDRSSTPFYNISATYGIIDDIGIGIYAGYFKSDSEMLSTAETVAALANILGANVSLGDVIGNTEYSVFSVGGKLQIHRPIFGDIKKLDTYASTYLGYNFVNDDISIDVSDNSIINSLASNLIQSAATFPKVTYEVNAGAKYDISEQVAVFGEAGYGRFLVNAGLTYHLNNNKNYDNRKPDAKDY